MFDNAVDELIARTRIEETLLRFCRGIDRKDWALLLSAFHEDATDDHGSVKGLAHEVLVPALQSLHETVAHSVHYLTNLSITFVSDTAASVESYVLVAQRRPEPAADGLGAGTQRTVASVRYVDRFERRDGDAWLIASRILVWGDMLTVGDDDTTFALPAHFVEQRRDRTDAISAQEDAMGIRRP